MSKKFERFKDKEDKRSHYDKPKKQRRPQVDEPEVDAYKLLKSGYSVEDLASLDWEN